MSSFIFLSISFAIFFSVRSEDIGTCDQKFHIFKNTVASSDSRRECANFYKIFPYIHDEGADKFHDGECAYQCKLELNDTCFKIHAPQTWQHDEGILPVHIFERKMSMKWDYVLNDEYPYDYDTFLDFNMAFWVQSLDDYMMHWHRDNDNNFDLEYIGIKWSPDWDLQINDEEYTQNQKFYSILVHSPESSINFEFISYKKPKHKFVKHIKWINSDIPRSTFKLMTPWDRKDNAQIVPVRISRATSSIDKIYNFYTSIMEANLINFAVSDKPVEKDSNMKIKTKSMFLALQNTKIELQFVERPNYYTTSDFSLIDYENMLKETHDTIITSPYCGVDRHLDNHYAYSTWTVDGLMDRIKYRLDENKLTYRIWKAPYDKSSYSARANLEAYGKDVAFGITAIEPTGQSISIGGYINDVNAQRFTPVGNAQWCYEPCPGGLKEGWIDPKRKYVDLLMSDDDYIAPDNIYGDDDGGMVLFKQDIKRVSIKRNGSYPLIAKFGIGFVFIIGVGFVLFDCAWIFIYAYQFLKEWRMENDSDMCEYSMIVQE